MATVIRSYNVNSESANKLAEKMGVEILGKNIHLIQGDPSIKVINWGNGEDCAPLNQCKVFNKPAAVRLAVNKLRSFEKFKAAGVSTPDWTTSSKTAEAWGTKVVCRTRLEGKDGDGIILTKPSLPDGYLSKFFTGTVSLPAAKLYVKFIKASSEYRVNVCGGLTMGVQLKVPTTNNANPDIKTGGNGYAFKLLEENEIPKGIRPLAKEAVTALGLDFGGVDIIVTEGGGKYVLEVNTAPELTPSMVTAYANKLRNM